MEYDYVIVGGGPAGLATATILADRYSVALIEREKTIGGCHRVRRDSQGYFGEHGPRVYAGSYATLDAFLQKIGLSWDAVFTKTHFAPDELDGKRWYQHLRMHEILALCFECIPFFLWNPSRGSKESVLHFCQRWNFTHASVAYMDRICRLSDGAGADRYPMHKFMSGFNEHALYNFYRPRVPNDELLFPAWQRYLENTGNVSFFLGHTVENLSRNGIVSLRRDVTLRARRGVILAVPPENTTHIFKHSRLPLPPSFESFAEQTEYNEYFSVSYHFKTPITVELFKSTPWDIVYLPQFGGTVLSTSATSLKIPSPRTGKTVHQCTRREIAQEILTQLRVATHTPLTPTRAVVSSGLVRGHEKWDDVDTAFVKTAQSDFWPSFTLLPGIFTVGAHTGHSRDAFTSMETAVQNALALTHSLHRVQMKPRYAWTIRHVILAFLFIGAFFIALNTRRYILWK